LKYYDKLYTKALNNRHPSKIMLTELTCSTVNSTLNADEITSKEFLIK